MNKNRWMLSSPAKTGRWLICSIVFEPSRGWWGYKEYVRCVISAPRDRQVPAGEGRRQADGMNASRLPLRSDIAPGRRIWGLAAQVYGLRSDGDCGIGDTAGVVALGRAAASMDADVLALSPAR
jgi:hypothetical protein